MLGLCSQYPKRGIVNQPLGVGMVGTNDLVVLCNVQSIRARQTDGKDEFFDLLKNGEITNYIDEVFLLKTVSSSFGSIQTSSTDNHRYLLAHEQKKFFSTSYRFWTATKG